MEIPFEAASKRRPRQCSLSRDDVSREKDAIYRNVRSDILDRIPDTRSMIERKSHRCRRRGARVGRGARGPIINVHDKQYYRHCLILFPLSYMYGGYVLND